MMLVPIALFLWDDVNQHFNRDNIGGKLTIIVAYDRFELLRENKSLVFLL